MERVGWLRVGMVVRESEQLYSGKRAPTPNTHVHAQHLSTVLAHRLRLRGSSIFSNFFVHPASRYMTCSSVCKN